MKKTHLLTALLMFCMAAGAAHAENFARQTIQATLPAYVDIKAEEGTLQKNIDPQTGNLLEAFNSEFTISSNDNLDLYLKAETIADGGVVMPGFFQKGENVYLILGHKTMRPSSVAIEDIRSGSAIPINNPNAIAYPVTGVNLSGKFNTLPTFDTAKNQYQFNIDQGVTTAKTTISPNVDSTTYSFDDRAGVYEAFIILTDTTT